MRVKRPSPAMVVACVALFVAMGGTSIAAVNYARNAGQVDGKNAYKSSRSRDKVAGGLVATYPGGALKGRIAHRFLAQTPLSRPFAKGLEVADNAASVPVKLTGTSIGTLTTTCADQSPRAGVEDPVSTVAFQNTSGTAINVAKRVGTNRAVVGFQENGTSTTLTVAGSNTFEFVLGIGNTEVLVEGVVRQDGARSPAATCIAYGSAVELES
jgi:hypothetical protein